MARRSAVLPSRYTPTDHPLTDEEISEAFGGVIEAAIRAIGTDVSYLCEFAYVGRALAEGRRAQRPEAGWASS